MKPEDEEYIDLNKLTVRELLVQTYQKVLQLEREMELRRKWKDDVTVELTKLKIEMDNNIRNKSLMWSLAASIVTAIIIEVFQSVMKH